MGAFHDQHKISVPFSVRCCLRLLNSLFLHTAQRFTYIQTQMHTIGCLKSMVERQNAQVVVRRSLLLLTTNEDIAVHGVIES